MFGLAPGMGGARMDSARRRPAENSRASEGGRAAHRTARRRHRGGRRGHPRLFGEIARSKRARLISAEAAALRLIPRLAPAVVEGGCPSGDGCRVIDDAGAHGAGSGSCAGGSCSRHAWIQITGEVGGYELRGPNALRQTLHRHRRRDLRRGSWPATGAAARTSTPRTSSTATTAACSIVYV